MRVPRGAYLDTTCSGQQRDCWPLLITISSAAKASAMRAPPAPSGRFSVRPMSSLHCLQITVAGAFDLAPEARLFDGEVRAAQRGMTQDQDRDIGSDRNRHIDRPALPLRQVTATVVLARNVARPATWLARAPRRPQDASVRRADRLRPPEYWVDPGSASARILRPPCGSHPVIGSKSALCAPPMKPSASIAAARRIFDVCIIVLSLFANRAPGDLALKFCPPAVDTLTRRSCRAATYCRARD